MRFWSWAIIAITAILLMDRVNYLFSCHGRSVLKSCYSNIRSIESAIEMYNMETIGGPMIAIDKARLKKYFSGDTFPECFQGGMYERISAKDISVRCSVHGTYADSDDTALFFYAKKEQMKTEYFLYLLLGVSFLAELGRMFQKKEVHSQNVQEHSGE